MRCHFGQDPMNSLGALAPSTELKPLTEFSSLAAYGAEARLYVSMWALSVFSVVCSQSPSSMASVLSGSSVEHIVGQAPST